LRVRVPQEVLNLTLYSMTILGFLLAVLGTVVFFWGQSLDPLPGEKYPNPPMGWNWQDYEVYINKQKKWMLIGSISLWFVSAAILLYNLV